MCCLFGLIDCGHSLTPRQKTRLISVLATACEERGTDATGIAYNAGGRLRVYKRPLPARKMRFRIPGDAHVIMGHTRMTTQGSERKNYNNHPFLGSTGDTRFALAHNGVLRNDKTLRRTLHLPNTNIETDSYIAVQLIQQKKALHLNSLKYMAEQVEGSFAFTVLDEADRLYFVKGDNPICLYHYPKAGVYLYASTESILRRAVDRLHMPLGKAVRVNVEEGDILSIDKTGREELGHFTPQMSYWDLYCPSYWRPQPAGNKRSAAQQEYLDALRYTAAYQGYDPGLVDAMLHDGFSLDEVEEGLCTGALV